MQSVVLQYRADFAIQTGVVTRIRRVTSKDNVLADPVSRLALETFKEEARKLGAKKFVRLPMASEATALIAALGSRLAELEEDGDPTSGTASSVAEVMAREQRYIGMKGDDEPEPNASEPTGAPAAARWGFMSGFCGADSMSFAAQALGGVPVAGFDVDETVQRLWSERTGIPCWGEFSSVLDAAADGLLDDLASSILIYISGSPCPDFSSARGHERTTGASMLRARVCYGREYVTLSFLPNRMVLLVTCRAHTRPASPVHIDFSSTSQFVRRSTRARAADGVGGGCGGGAWRRCNQRARARRDRKRRGPSGERQLSEPRCRAPTFSICSSTSLVDMRPRKRHEHVR